MVERRAWEYVIRTWTDASAWGGIRGREGMRQMLDSLGAEGWELASVTDDGQAAVLFLKRRVDAPRGD